MTRCGFSAVDQSGGCVEVKLSELLCGSRDTCPEACSSGDDGGNLPRVVVVEVAQVRGGWNPVVF